MSKRDVDWAAAWIEVEWNRGGGLARFPWRGSCNDLQRTY
jgi:hypothetical protein